MQAQASLRQRPIRFGTSGWRGVLGDEFTLPRVRSLVRAVGAWLGERSSNPRVLLGHDTRFAGPQLCDQAAAVLVESGVAVSRARGPVPTPVASHAVVRRRLDAALVFTASHNPASYHGLKVIGASGGGITEQDARRIEALVTRAGAPSEARAVRATPSQLDVVDPFLEELLTLLDRDALRSSKLRIVYDAMHGAGAGVLDRVLSAAGLQVETLRADSDIRFGSASPDPSQEQLSQLSSTVRRLRGPVLGLATDGDADRYAVIDADGSLLSETEAVSLLVDQLARSGRIRRGVAISIATGSLVERVAKAYGLAVERHAIGFKHLSASLAQGRSDAAGEESGGFAWSPFARDKDGILAACLMAELAAQLGRPLRARLAELERAHGRCHCARTALPATPERRQRVAELGRTPPQQLRRAKVRAVDTRDGVHLGLEDGFLMLRASGTEPMVRVYAEAPSRGALAARLRLGCRLLDGATS